MNVQLRPIAQHEQGIFLNIYQFYIFDMSRFFEKHLAPNGLFDFDTTQFDLYWNSDKHWPYFITVDNRIAGFCLVRWYPEALAVEPSTSGQRYDIEQFFVLNHYKHQGVGAQAFKLAINLHPGDWLIRVLAANTPALKFWQRSITAITGHPCAPIPTQEHGTAMNFFYFTGQPD